MCLPRRAEEVGCVLTAAFPWRLRRGPDRNETMVMSSMPMVSSRSRELKLSISHPHPHMLESEDLAVAASNADCVQENGLF